MNTPRQELEQTIEALQSLEHHPGWAIITAQLKRRADHEMVQMRNSTTQDSLLKHTYTYMALSDLPQAPRLLLEAMTRQLQSQTKP